MTDDAAGLKAQLQAATGERIAALEGTGQMALGTRDSVADAERWDRELPDGLSGSPAGKKADRQAPQEKAMEPTTRARSLEPDMDLGL